MSSSLSSLNYNEVNGGLIGNVESHIAIALSTANNWVDSGYQHWGQSPAVKLGRSIADFECSEGGEMRIYIRPPGISNPLMKRCVQKYFHHRFNGLHVEFGQCYAPNQIEVRNFLYFNPNPDVIRMLCIPPSSIMDVIAQTYPQYIEMPNGPTVKTGKVPNSPNTNRHHWVAFIFLLMCICFLLLLHA